MAEVAGVSRQLVSRVESGDVAHIQSGVLERVIAAVGGTLDAQVRWHGEGLDRLLNSAHAALVERVVAMLRAEGWETAVEVSFAIRGERGSVDVVGLRRDLGAILIVEVKTVIPDAGGMLSTLDRKVAWRRRSPHSWAGRAARCPGCIVVGDSTTTRRRVRLLAATLSAVLPVRGWAVRRWLREPSGVSGRG